MHDLIYLTPNNLPLIRHYRRVYNKTVGPDYHFPTTNLCISVVCSELVKYVVLTKCQLKLILSIYHS